MQKLHYCKHEVFSNIILLSDKLDNRFPYIFKLIKGLSVRAFVIRI